MSPSAVRLVYVKEMRNLLRDPHVLMYSVAVPAFLYPVMILGMLEIFSYVKAMEERRETTLEIVGYEEARPLRRFLEQEAACGSGDRARSRILVLPPAVPSLEERDARSRLVGPDTAPAPDALIDARSVPAKDGADLDAWRVRIYYSSALEASAQARDRAESHLEEWRRDLLLAAARKVGEGEDLLEPLAVEEESLSTPEEVASHLAGLMLPLLMILMTGLGALYPALEATVAEKERGTLETTLLAPVGRSTLVAGKYLAVTTVSLLSFTLNFAGLLFTLVHLGSQLPTRELAVGFRAVLVILLAAALLAALLSAAMMLLAFLARSFKEGQSYVTPIYLLTIVPVLVATHPAVRLTPGLALVPLINTTLLFREALEKRFPPLEVALTLGTNAVCALVALALAARILARESVATGGEVSLRRLLRGMIARGGRREVLR
ncbi:MAG: ABC transporter permease subunit [Planctomycetes bacterium]|nr:ABC transporter permease subunit [Planctomycetota bacterium]